MRSSCEKDLNLPDLAYDVHACHNFASVGILSSMGRNTRTPNKLWLLVKDDPNGCHLAKLALRLFGVGVNSASTERFFSQAGLTEVEESYEA